MGKKSQRNGATRQAARQGGTDGGVPAALARQSARPAPGGTARTPAPPRKGGKSRQPNIASLRVDEEQYNSRGCAPAAVVDSEPQGLAATYSFDTPEADQPYPVAIRFTGTRVGAKARPDAGDRFEQTERIEGLTAGMGRVALTTRVQNVNAGEWKVLASPVEQPHSARANGALPRRVVATRTRFSRLAQGPSVRLTAWPALVGLGAVVAVALQVLLAAQAGMKVGAVLGLSIVGCLLGFVGGKAWYLALHRKHPRAFLTAGACIQGFLLVASVRSRSAPRCSDCHPAHCWM